MTTGTATQGEIVARIEAESYPGEVGDLDLSVALGVTPGGIRSLRADLGIRSAPQRRRIAIQRMIENERNPGDATDCKIARALNLHPSTVLHSRRRLGILSAPERKITGAIR